MYISICRDKEGGGWGFVRYVDHSFSPYLSLGYENFGYITIRNSLEGENLSIQQRFTNDNIIYEAPHRNIIETYIYRLMKKLNLRILNLTI